MLGLRPGEDHNYDCIFLDTMGQSQRWGLGPGEDHNIDLATPLMDAGKPG